MRCVTSVLWLFVALALGFDAMAQPCELRAGTDIQVDAVEQTEMACHETKSTTNSTTTHNKMPERQSDTCCCAALFTTAISLDHTELKQPVPMGFAWSTPINITADSIAFEYEPPPPRA